MKPEIIRKLNEFIDTHAPFKEECEAVYLMVELRKLLDRAHEKGQFARVRFYCDWTVHISKAQHHDAIQDIIEELNEILNNNGSPYPKEDIVSLFSFSELRKEMTELFRIHGLRTALCQDDKHWEQFVNVFIQVLADQPIINLINGISSVSFAPGNIGTRTVTIEFTDQRNSITIGVGDY